MWIWLTFSAIMTWPTESDAIETGLKLWFFPEYRYWNMPSLSTAMTVFLFLSVYNYITIDIFSNVGGVLVKRLILRVVLYLLKNWAVRAESDNIWTITMTNADQKITRCRACNSTRLHVSSWKHCYHIIGIPNHFYLFIYPITEHCLFIVHA